MTEGDILRCRRETCRIDGVGKGRVNRPLAATGLGTKREQVSHYYVDSVRGKGTREEAHHCADIFAVFAIPLLLRAHHGTSVHDVTLTYEWERGNTRHFSASGELDHAAFFGTRRLRPDEYA